MQHGSSGLAYCNCGYLTPDGAFAQGSSYPVTTMHSPNAVHEHVSEVPSANFNRAQAHYA
jgi:hypothetical protein